MPPALSQIPTLALFLICTALLSIAQLAIAQPSEAQPSTNRPASNSQCQTIAAMPPAADFAPLAERLPPEHPTRASIQTLESWRTETLARCPTPDDVTDDATFRTMRHRADFLREATVAVQRLEDYRARRQELIDLALANGEVDEATHTYLLNQLHACFDPTYPNLPAGEGGASQFHAWNTPIERCLSTLDLRLRDLSNDTPSSGALFWLLLASTLALSIAGVGIAYAKHRKNERETNH